MFERIIRFAIEHRWLVLLAVLGMAAYGVYNYQKLPIDAVPDITNVQVQINTAAPGYSPLETEQRISYPIETAMSGLPQLEQVRSLKGGDYRELRLQSRYLVARTRDEKKSLKEIDKSLSEVITELKKVMAY